MAKRKPRNRPKGRPARRRSTNRRARREPDLIELVVDACEDGSPIALLGLASSLLSAVDPRTHPLEDFDEPEATRADLVEALLSAPMPETSALITAIAALTGDDVLGRRIAQVAALNGHASPAWLNGIARTAPRTHAVELVDAFGDMSEIVVGATLADGQELSAVVSVDHNAGSVVVDGFLVPEAIDTVIAAGLDSVDEGDLTARPLAPADARARIVEAIGYGEFCVPPYETETWPSSRPGLEWLVGLLPEGGSGFPRPTRDDDALAELARRFRASPFAEDVADPGDLLSALLSFGSGCGPGDPMRWSPASAEVLLLDWLPRTIVAEVPDLEPAPDLLRAFVRFCHHERGMRPELTEQTIAEIDAMAPEYQELIRAERPQDAAAPLSWIGIDEGDPDDEPAPGGPADR
jgi:hypothetical protein